MLGEDRRAPQPAGRSIIGLITCVLVRGIKESARVNSVIVFLKIAIILVFIGAGIFLHQAGNCGQPFIPPNTGQPGFFGGAASSAAPAIMFFAYLGFDAVSTAAQEAKNPKRDMPIGILGSLFACTLLYIAFSLVLTGVCPTPSSTSRPPWPWPSTPCGSSGSRRWSRSRPSSD